MGIEILITAIAAILAGFGGGAWFFSNKSKQKTDELNAKADRLISESRQIAERTVSDAKREAKSVMSNAEKENESIKRQKILEVKEKNLQLRKKLEKELKDRKQKVESREKKNKVDYKNLQVSRDEIMAQKDELQAERSEIQSIKDNLKTQIEVVNEKKLQLEKSSEEHIKALENVAQLNREDAKEAILKAVREKAELDAMALVKDRMTQANLTANKEAKKIVIQSIQRMCHEYAVENTVSVFNLDNDDQKGQIIGREGRNIRALEAATGAEIVVDDTPGAIVISSFDPYRREICRLSLKRLVADGRIHPARIEEVVAKTKKELDEKIMEIGERAVIDLDIHGLNPVLVKLVGRMRYRSSYGQNLLKHSIETAHLCSIMAAELGFNQKEIKLAKRAGLLHDIGKVAEDTEKSHALVGMDLCQKHGENKLVQNAVGAHHDEIPMANRISPVVQACDAISGARPGARRDILESYLKRIGDLEKLALSHEGVDKAYAMQAGRELRVIVEAERVTDKQADDLSFQISQQIQDEMQYPGQIKVTVIREKRAVNYAR